MDWVAKLMSLLGIKKQPRTTEERIKAQFAHEVRKNTPLGFDDGSKVLQRFDEHLRTWMQ